MHTLRDSKLKLKLKLKRIKEKKRKEIVPQSLTNIFFFSVLT